MSLLLASSSPRRRDLLRHLNLPFDVVPSRVDERPPEKGEPAETYALALAREKAADVWCGHQDDVVLAADTVVSVGGQILGKPGDRDEALTMLSALRGRWHAVVTAVVVRCQQHQYEGVISTHVRMRDYSAGEMRRYVDGGEPIDKAGAYAVQGAGGSLVEAVHGCYNAVVGLPLCLTADLLQLCGLPLDVLPDRCCADTAGEKGA